MRQWLVIGIALFVLVASGAFLIFTQQSHEPAVAPVEAEVIPTPAPVSLDQVHFSVEEFRALGAEVMKSLPVKSAEQTESVPPLVKAGAELGKIGDAVAKDPALTDEALTLYRECAASPQHPDSIRALCFSNYRRLAKKSGKAYDEHVVRKNIRDLAEKLEF